VLQGFIAQLGHWLDKVGDLPALDLVGLPPEQLRVLNETLGEGEVSAVLHAPHPIHIQETVFAGVWRQQHLGERGQLQHDLLLAAPVPALLAAVAEHHADSRLRDLPLPAGAMNVSALLHELQEAMHSSDAGSAAHVINLTLLPLSAPDSAHLDALLDGGAVTLLSRGFGNCRISSTAARHVWRVQYFNNMQTLILNTLEVVAIPEVAIAAREDLHSSHARLTELVAWMSASLATA
jgi:hydrogenase-1 operon protein HyaF